MVQEVQTSVWIQNPTTLDVIEWIGTSSFKLTEWRQVISDNSIINCKISSTVSWNYQRWGSTYSWDIYSNNITIISQTWEFDIRANDEYLQIRVPIAWKYKIETSWWSWGSTFSMSVEIKASNKTIISDSTSSSSDSLWWEATVSLWKYDLITHIGTFTYRWSSSGAGFSDTEVITITKI